MAQVSRADHDQMVVLPHAQDAADLLPQGLHMVAVALLAEAAETAQILADLGGRDAHLAPQGTGGDPRHAPGVQLPELAVISRQTPDDGV